MSDFSKPVLTQIEALINSTWTDVDFSFRVSVGSWYNWRDRIGEGDLTPPFAVVSVLSEVPTADWGPTNKTYNLGIALYYVRSTDLTAGEEAGGATKVEDLIYPKIAAMRDALIANRTAFQLIDDPVTSVGLDNPANEYLATNSDPFWAGELTFTVLAGESYL